MKSRIGVLFGGPSNESEVSKRSGKKVCDALLKRGHDAHLVEYNDDVAEKIKNECDVVFNIMHGRPGEDGVVQGLLEHLNIPYTGSGVIPSAITMNKYINQQIVKSFGIPVLKSLYITKQILIEDPDIIKTTFKSEVILKPNTGGSSVGAFISSPDDASEKLMREFDNYEEYIAEEYIHGGTEVTVGIIEDDGVKVLTPLQLVPKNEFYDYQAKYTAGMTDFVIPPKLNSDTIKKMMKMSESIFKKLNMHTFARIDFIVKKDGELYELEVNSIPGMTDLSDLPQEAEFDGIPYEILVEKLLKTAGVKKDA